MHAMPSIARLVSISSAKALGFSAPISRPWRGTCLKIRVQFWRPWRSAGRYFAYDVLPADVISGADVINYVNKFGQEQRTYKRRDPVSELYAEVMKYLKGMTVTPSYVSSVSNVMRDGFPVFGESGGPAWVDPARDTSDSSYPNSPALWCKRSYIIGIGDTNTWNDQNLSGRTDVSVPSGVDSNMAGGTMPAPRPHGKRNRCRNGPRRVKLRP